MNHVLYNLTTAYKCKFMYRDLVFDSSSVSILLVQRMKILLENSSTKQTHLFFSFSFPSPLCYFPMFSRQPNGRETNGSSVLGTITVGNVVLSHQITSA